MGVIRDRNGNIIMELPDNYDFLVDPYICIYEANEPRITDNMHLLSRELVGNIRMYVRFNLREDVMEKLGENAKEKSGDGDYKASCVATKEIIEHIGINEEFLFQRAIRNTPGQLKNINDHIEELSGVSLVNEGQRVPVWVANTKDRVFDGAGCLSNIKWLEEVRKDLGDFYIIPSSRHELIFVEAKMVKKMGTGYLKFMVNDVNRTVLNPGDKLSDDVFMFDGNGLHVV